MDLLNHIVMNQDFEMTLDELVDFALTDKYVCYSDEELNQLKDLMCKRLALITDKDEHEFYSGVIESLMFEINKHIVNNNTNNRVNPLKDKYMMIEKRIWKDVDNTINKTKQTFVVQAAKVRFEKLPYDFCKWDSFKIYQNNYVSTLCSSLKIDGRYVIYPADKSSPTINSEGENLDDLLTASGRPKNVR